MHVGDNCGDRVHAVSNGKSVHRLRHPAAAGRASYETNNNHYTIYDTKGDSRAVAVLFERENGTDVGFQSCHERSGDNCPGDLPSSVGGKLFMAVGVGLGSDKSGYTFGPLVEIPNAWLS